MRWIYIFAFIAIGCLFLGCGGKGEELEQPETLQEMGKISGKVILKDQLNLPNPDHSGVDVFVEGYPDLSVKTAVDGSYTISDLSPGPYQLVFSKKGYVTRKEVVEVTGGELILPDIEMVPGGVISGKAIYEGERDHSGIKVIVLGTDLSAVTGPDGLYRFEDVKPGEYTIEATSKGYSSGSVRIKVESGTETTASDIILKALEIYGEVKLETAMRWEKPQVNEFTIKPDGSVEPPGVQPNSFIQGKWHPELKNNPIFNVDYPATGKLVIRARSVATGGAMLIISIDGTEVLREEIRDKDGSNDSSLHELDMDITVVVPRGKHRIALDNIGNDWVAVDWFIFSNYRKI